MNSISKDAYIDELDDIFNKHINKYHSTIKMKLFDVKSNTHIYSTKKISDKDSKFKIGDIVRIPKYKNIFAKGYVPNYTEEAFVIKKVKNTMTWTYVISDLKDKEIVGMFIKKNYKIQKKKKKNSLELKK